MATKNKSYAVKTIVFMSSEFFCSITDVFNLRQGEIEWTYKIPKEVRREFRKGIKVAINNIILSDSKRQKRITRKVIESEIRRSVILPKYLKPLNISPEEIVEGIENANMYLYRIKDNYYETLETIQYLYDKGYKLVLRDDMPETVLTEALKRMEVFEYFTSVQGMIGNYLSFTEKSMQRLVGRRIPERFLIVTNKNGKTSINDSAKKLNIPVLLCEKFDISDLKELL